MSRSLGHTGLLHPMPSQAPKAPAGMAPAKRPTKARSSTTAASRHLTLRLVAELTSEHLRIVHGLDDIHREVSP
jgi:hypothetical protein